MQPGVGSLPRVLFGHVASTVCAASAIFFTLVTVARLGGGRRRRPPRRSSRHPAAVRGDPGIRRNLPVPAGPAVRLLRVDANGRRGAMRGTPRRCGSPRSMAGWRKAAPGRVMSTPRCSRQHVPTGSARLEPAPARAVAGRVQQTLTSHRASLLTSLVRRVVHAGSWGTAVRGMAVFAAATLTRSRRHAVILASYAASPWQWPSRTADRRLQRSFQRRRAAARQPGGAARLPVLRGLRIAGRARTASGSGGQLAVPDCVAAHARVAHGRPG